MPNPTAISRAVPKWDLKGSTFVAKYATTPPVRTAAHAFFRISITFVDAFQSPKC
jgi:hypothetical protein